MAKFWADIVEKLNPVQPIIAQDEGTNIGTLQNDIGTVTNAYELLEIVSRSVNLLVDNASMVEYDVAGSLAFTGQVTGLRNKTLKNLLNSRPNPYMDISTFKRLLFMDFIIDGNCFIHFDGSSLYHIPADKMEIIPDQKHYINLQHDYFSSHKIVFVE